ncbi:MAG: adenine-specific methyltransferase EcoRI family protein [Mycoplasmataceae bacterium]|jgi:hypothetical protein|nr:adenine-specific methyltransferase EcoRI family protein [Mycoplasmataceae bacterium]
MNSIEKRTNFKTKTGKHILAKVWKAKKNKDDEYYTKYDDIKKELDNYDLRNKIIGLPCDANESQFVQYCKNNKLKYINGQSYEKFPYEKVDIVITNPPFSKWKDFYNHIKHKSFIVLGHKMVASHKQIFEDIKNNKVWWGFNCNKNMMFNRPDGTQVLVTCSWYTNIKHKIIDKELSNFIVIDENKFAMPPTALSYFDPKKYRIVEKLKNVILNNKKWMEKWVWEKK